MATEKKITSRIQQKHDVAANWAKATNFIPKKGEIIIYDAEYNASGEETQAVRFKIGDGSKTVNNLPFAVIDYSSDIETLEQKVANNSTAIGKIQGAFETNGTTVKKATSAGTADKVANGLTLGGGVVYDGSKALSITAGDKMSITGGPGGVSIGLAHSVMPSTYNKVTVDGYGTVTAGENVDYLTSHQSIKKLNTNNTAAQTVNASEAIAGSGTINLHKIAKTGSYNDLSNKPPFVSSVNGSSGAITNVAKTDETNVFTKSQIIQKPSDETQASLWNYSGCIAYSHWVQGSSSEPRIGIGYKNSGIRVFNGTTETPAQYYDVTMPPQAGQLVTDTFAKFTGETSGVANPYRVFPNEEAYAAYKSTPLGTPLDFKYTSQTYSTFIANTDANSRTALTDGRIVNKKNGTNYELTLPTKTGTLALTSDISGKLDKTTYEVNRTINFGQDGALYIGKFKVYDTNVTFEITSTTSVTYSGKLVIATQNYVIREAKVYGDAANTVTPNIYIKPSTTSDPYIEVYFKPESWSKNVIHIYGSEIKAEPTDVCTNVPSVPSTATLKPKNALDSKANLRGGNTFTGKQTFTDPPTNNAYSIDASGCVRGSWFQSSTIMHNDSNTGKVCVFDGSGWIFYRTPAEILTEAGGAKTADLPIKSATLTGTTLYLTL